jgi:hypothetical protein
MAVVVSVYWPSENESVISFPATVASYSLGQIVVTRKWIAAGGPMIDTPQGLHPLHRTMR